MTAQASDGGAQRGLPAGWRWVRLGDVTREVRNGLYKPEHFYGRGTPIVKMFNIGRLDGTWVLRRLDKVDLNEDEASAYLLQEGDIVLNRVNSRDLVGKCAVVDTRTANAVFESKNMRVGLMPTTPIPALWRCG